MTKKHSEEKFPQIYSLKKVSFFAVSGKPESDINSCILISIIIIIIIIFIIIHIAHHFYSHWLRAHSIFTLASNCNIISTESGNRHWISKDIQIFTCRGDVIQTYHAPTAKLAAAGNKLYKLYVISSNATNYTTKLDKKIQSGKSLTTNFTFIIFNFFPCWSGDALTKAENAGSVNCERANKRICTAISENPAVSLKKMW